MQTVILSSSDFKDNTLPACERASFFFFGSYDLVPLHPTDYSFAVELLLLKKQIKSHIPTLFSLHLLCAPELAHCDGREQLTLATAPANRAQVPKCAGNCKSERSCVFRYKYFSHLGKADFALPFWVMMHRPPPSQLCISCCPWRTFPAHLSSNTAILVLQTAIAHPRNKSGYGPGTSGWALIPGTSLV